MGKELVQDRSIDLTSVGGIIFNESDHTYTNSEGERYTGITTLLGNYHEHFDTDKTAINKAIKDTIIEVFGLKKYNGVRLQKDGDVVVDSKLTQLPDYQYQPVMNKAIKEATIKIHGEEGYLKLEQQVSGYDNLYVKYLTIKKHRPELHDEVMRIAKKEGAISSYGTEKYNLFKKQVGGFDNLHKKLDEFKEKRPRVYKKIISKIDELKDSWVETNVKATTEGTAEHDKREQKIYDDGGFEWNGTFFVYDESKNITNVTLEDQIVIPECLVWNHEMMLGGLADIFLFDKGIIRVLDYKTNRVVELEPKIDNPQFHKYMTGVCSELLDLNYYHYSLQLKIYQMMALMIRPEFKAGENTIIHTTSDTHYRDKDSIIECHDVEHIVPLIFEDVKERLLDGI